MTPLLRELNVLFGDSRTMGDLRALVLDVGKDPATRAEALASLVNGNAPDTSILCRQVLFAKGLAVPALRGLAREDDPNLGRWLTENYSRFDTEAKPAVIDTLATRPEWARPFLEAMENGGIARQELNAFQARQINALGDGLPELLAKAWGSVRRTADDRKDEIIRWRKALTPETLAGAGLPRGRLLFQGLCASCHKLYGEGGDIGPDLTGSGRSNLDYLLENIVDPGGVVGLDYQMSFLTLRDGRKLGGVVRGRDGGILTLRQPTGELRLEESEITREEAAGTSLMPEGLLQTMPPDQVRDLIAYLMHTAQVPLPE
jgi:putative heme-binding domain-containing protein